jgi:glutamate 5-kinase
VCAEQFAAAIREHQVLVVNSGGLASGVPRLSSFRAGKQTSQQGKQKGGACCVGQREIGTSLHAQYM